MKRSTAVGHLVEMAERCEEVNDRLGVLYEEGPRITAFWAFGKVLDPEQRWTDKDRWTDAAIVLQLPEIELAWLAPPEVAPWIQQMAGWGKRPVVLMWRSADGPVWNHRIVRPMLLWDAAAGLRHHAIAVLRDGEDIEHHREPAPSPEELAGQMARQLEISLAAVRKAAHKFESHRWGRGEVLGYADALFAATDGYLDLLSAWDDLGA